MTQIFGGEKRKAGKQEPETAKGGKKTGAGSGSAPKTNCLSGSGAASRAGDRGAQQLQVQGKQRRRFIGSMFL